MRFEYLTQRLYKAILAAGWLLSLIVNTDNDYYSK